MSPIDDRTPVLVGVGAVVQRGDDLASLVSPVELLWRAVEQAFGDSKGHDLAARTGLVAIPNGTWHDVSPAGVVARRLGSSARTLVAEIGITQQALLSRACNTIAAGDVDVVVVGGTEAKHRDKVARGQGRELPTPSTDGGPDELWLPSAEIISRAEIERELAVPTHQYAIVENALAPTDPAALWAAFARVAARNPDAWDQSAPSAMEIASARMIAAPYTRLLCSQWNVDQAAALVLTSAAAARAAGVPTDRWVFPIASAGSDLMVPLPMRSELARWPAFECCIEALSVGIDDVALIDLYSCFPAAVQVQARALGLALDDSRGLTITGGMTFAGGPLNSYVLQAMVTLARLLRDDHDAVGLSTSVSGMLTKPGIGLWSARPGTQPFVAHDATDAARAATATKPLVADATGPATIAGGTVLHDREGARATVAIVDLPDGGRSIALSTPDAATAFGTPVTLTAPGAYVEGHA